MRKLLSLLIASLLLAGCEDLAAESDKATKKLVVGHWLVEADDSHDGSMVREHVVHTEDGKFALERMIIAKDGLISRETEGGSWFITAGLYKMRTETVAGKPLGNAHFLYSTCRIETLSESEIVCKNDVNQWLKKQRRVPDNFKL
jgi:hypothetical protein